MIKPTIGRVVWFRDRHMHDVQPNCAFIAFVHSDHKVNLTVCRPSGETYGVQDVLLFCGDGARPPATIAFCEWMPYQKGQAARTEELERTVAEGFTKPASHHPV